MNIKTAIFDMDGTLVDSLMFWDYFWGELGKKYFNDSSFRPSEEDDKKVRTLTLKEAMELIHRNYNIGESGIKLFDLATDMVKDFYATKVEVKEGVIEFLEYLKTKGVRMCVASATARNLLEIAIDHCSLGKYFEKVFSCADIGKGKEYPDIFIMARDYFKSKTEETWLFEDSLVAINTATKIGMPTVGIYDKYNFGQDEAKKLATIYINEGETLLKLVN